jgi:segregation and condensation protein B
VAPHLERVEARRRRLSKAAMETLAIIAYQQPVTRAEIEAVRGVPVARGTLDQLVRRAGSGQGDGARCQAGGHLGDHAGFLDQFQLGSLDDLPRWTSWSGRAVPDGRGRRLDVAEAPVESGDGAMSSGLWRCRDRLRRPGFFANCATSAERANRFGSWAAASRGSP